MECVSVRVSAREIVNKCVSERNRECVSGGRGERSFVRKFVWVWGMLCVCVHERVCVCEREMERDRVKERTRKR